MELLAIVLGLLPGVIFGVVTGILIGTNRMKKSIEEGCVGDLRIDRSIEDEPPRPCLEVYRGNTVDSISQKKFVILRVINENYLSSN